MAETLGSLVDKLTIKGIRAWHIENEQTTLDPSQKKNALNSLAAQKRDLVEEINDFVQKALEGSVRGRDQKFKLYKNPRSAFSTYDIGALMELLAQENLTIWRLEDEVRRDDIPDRAIVLAKRKIDASNQRRNDLIDRIDEALEAKIKTNAKNKRSKRNK